MSSGTFKAVLSSAAAISAAAVKSCATAQRMPGARAVAPGHAAGEPIAPPTSSHLIVTAPAEVRIPLILRPEIDLGKLPLSAAGMGSGRSPIEAADMVQDALLTATEGRMLIDLIASSVEPGWGREGVLEFVQVVAEALQSTPASMLRLPPTERVAVLHFLAKLADRFTQHVTIAGISHRCRCDVANLMRPIFLAAQQQERELLKAGGMGPESAAMLAEILFLYARKGRYFYALRERAEGWQTGRSELAASVLYMAEASHRFSALGIATEAERIRGLLGRVRKEHGISGEPAPWAFKEYRAYLLRQRHQMRELAHLGDSLPFRADIARLYYDGMVAGLSNFAPSLLLMAEKIFSDARFEADAERFRYWKVFALNAARRMHASTTPTATRNPAADSDE